MECRVGGGLVLHWLVRCVNRECAVIDCHGFLRWHCVLVGLAYCLWACSMLWFNALSLLQAGLSDTASVVLHWG